MVQKFEIEFDSSFEQDVITGYTTNNAKIYSFTVKKQRAQEIGLKGGEYVRVMIEYGGKQSIFETKVNTLKSSTGKSFRIIIPIKNAKYLNIGDDNKLVRVYIKILEK